MNVRTVITMLFVLLASFGILFYVSQRKSARTKPTELDTIIVGTNAEYPPFSFIDNEQIVGFDIDIIKEIAHHLNKKITFKNMSFAALLPELQLGTIHVIAAGMTPSEEKAKRVFFTTVYFDKDPLMVVQHKSEPTISNARELQGHTVAVNQGYTSDIYVSTIPNIELIRLSSPMVNTGIMTLQSKQADAYVASKSALNPYFAKQKTDTFQVTPLEDTEETYALAVSKKYPELYSAVQSALTTMIEDGTVQKIKESWGLI